MASLFLILCFFIVSYFSGVYWVVHRTSQGESSTDPKKYYGLFVAFLATVPPFTFIILDFLLPVARWLGVETYQIGVEAWPSIRFVLALSLFCVGLGVGHKYVCPSFRARNVVETFIVGFLAAVAGLTFLATIGIISSLVYEAFRFFSMVGLGDFLFGLEWSTQPTLSSGGKPLPGSFGILPLLSGTLLIAIVALGFALPFGVMFAIYMNFYARRTSRYLFRPLIETLAGMPTIVYGFFAALTVAPFFHKLGKHVGMSISAESALATGLTMGFMILPLIASMTDDALSRVSKHLINGSFALGSTRYEMITRVAIPAAAPGIISGCLLAFSRAVGETMIVIMAAGLVANLTANPFEAVTTITAQILQLLIGDQQFDSPKTLAAYALGLSLLLITLGINYLGLRIEKYYRKRYS